MSDKMSPDQVKSNLLRAFQTGDQNLLARLCQTHQVVILEHFGDWSKIPSEVRSDQALVRQYVETLITVATFFAERLDKPQLMQRMMAPNQSSPLEEWLEVLRQARSLMDKLQYEQATDLLLTVLEKVRGLQGTGVDKYLPITYGFLGECYLQQGQAFESIEPFRTALRLCEQTSDIEGIVAYWQNLYETYRYLGDQEQAVTAAEHTAQILRNAGDQRRGAIFEKRARIVRAGEPLNRVVLDAEGERFELSELALVSAQHVQFFYERNRITLRAAQELTERGERFGGEGKFEWALDAFQQAAEADSFDPHCLYLAGLTLLHLRRYTEAVEAYQATEAAAPGWFHCRHNLWLARQLAEKRISHETFQIVRQLEDSALEPRQKIRLANTALQTAPDVAPLHFFLGENQAESGDRKAAETAYRKGLTCVEDPDLHTRLLLNLGILLGSKTEGIDLLRQAQALNGNLVAAAMAAFALNT
jgi:tetratricopeptide (TPR) repeat protein